MAEAFPGESGITAAYEEYPSTKNSTAEFDPLTEQNLMSGFESQTLGARPKRPSRSNVVGGTSSHPKFTHTQNSNNEDYDFTVIDNRRSSRSTTRDNPSSPTLVSTTPTGTQNTNMESNLPTRPLNNVLPSVTAIPVQRPLLQASSSESSSTATDRYSRTLNDDNARNEECNSLLNSG